MWLTDKIDQNRKTPQDRKKFKASSHWSTRITIINMCGEWMFNLMYHLSMGMGLWSYTPALHTVHYVSCVDNSLIKINVLEIR